MYGAVQSSAECGVFRVEGFVMPASTRRLLAAHILLFVSWCSIACCAFPITRNSTLRATAPTTVTPAQTPALSPAFGPLASDCEHNTLRLLGWQQAYCPHGYTINTQLPSNCSAAIWQGLGCLKTLTNLTLTGSLPDLPDAWGANDSFPALQAINFSSASLAGTLPSSWALDMALPQLQMMDFSMTQLSGQLPSIWGQRGAFKQLKALHLSQVSIVGESASLARLCCSLVHWTSIAWQPFQSTICTRKAKEILIMSTYSCQAFLKSSCKPCNKCVSAQVQYLSLGERLVAFLPFHPSNWEALS